MKTRLWKLIEARGTEQIPLPAPAVRRALRLAAGLRQEDVGRVLGVTAVAVCRYESGRREPRGALRARYAELLEELRRG